MLVMVNNYKAIDLKNQNTLKSNQYLLMVKLNIGLFPSKFLMQ